MSYSFDDAIAIAISVGYTKMQMAMYMYGLHKCTCKEYKQAYFQL